MSGQNIGGMPDMPPSHSGMAGGQGAVQGQVGMAAGQNPAPPPGQIGMAPDQMGMAPMQMGGMTAQMGGMTAQMGGMSLNQSVSNIVVNPTINSGSVSRSYVYSIYCVLYVYKYISVYMYRSFINKITCMVKGCTSYYCLTDASFATTSKFVRSKKHLTC